MIYRSYGIVGGQRDGQAVKTNGVEFLRIPRLVSVPLSTTISKATNTMSVHPVDEYRLSKFVFADGRVIECYRLVGMSDDDALSSIMNNR